LVSDLTKLSAFRPLLSRVEVLWEITHESLVLTFRDLVLPILVDDCSESLSDVRGLGFEESAVFTSVPSSFHRVNSSDMFIMIDNEVFEAIDAHFDLSTDLFS
jgi:hypothetical protein